jgi:hypothetical protein
MLVRSVMSCLLFAASYTASAAQDDRSLSVVGASQDVSRDAVDARAVLGRMREYFRNTADLEFETTFSIFGGSRRERGRTLYRIRQPNFFHVDVVSGNKTYTFVSDGKALTIYRQKERKFAQMPARDSVVGTMYAAIGVLAIQARVLDFFWTVDYANMSGEVKVAAIEAAIVGNRKCNGLSVERFEDRWEVWLEASGAPLPCKLVSRRKDGSSMTVQSNEFTWTTNPKFAPGTFEFLPPQGSKKVEAIGLE